MRKIVMMWIMVVAVGICPVYVWAQPPEVEKEEAVVTFIKEVNPSLAKHLERVRSVNFEEYRRMLEDVSRRYREIKELEIRQPDLAKKAVEELKLEGQITELAEQYRQTSDNQGKEKLRVEIKNLLMQTFDNKIALQEAHAAFIENEVQRLRARIAQKKQNKDKIIEKKISDLTAEEYLLWD